MEASDLKLVELDEELRNKVLKDIVAVVQELGGLFVSQDLLDVLVWSLKVREKKNEDFLLVT